VLGARRQIDSIVIRCPVVTIAFNAAALNARW
jgi:hypothetical protein